MPSKDIGDETTDEVTNDAVDRNGASRADGAGGLPTVSPDIIEQEVGDEMDNVVPTYGYRRLPVVALGGSAGGIQALRAFFAALPPATGAAYVVVLHLSPEHESTLPELLRNACSLPVKAT